MYLSETYEKKMAPVLEHPDLPKIEDSYKLACYICNLGKPRTFNQRRQSIP